jgi:hypoxanthine-guanine phosphoribosyltransferase
MHQSISHKVAHHAHVKAKYMVSSSYKGNWNSTKNTDSISENNFSIKKKDIPNHW